MDSKNRMLLQRYQQDILRDLDVSFILDELYTKNVITPAEFDHICNLSDRVERSRYLIESIIHNGNNNCYEALLDCLAKDYRWLWEKLVTENGHEMMLNDSFEDSLSRGDVPRLPDHFVRRTELEGDLAHKLRLLARHNFLVLHGMSGSGKTTVAISVLRDNPELVTNNFNGAVFWLNGANCKTEDDIIAQQIKLYRKASSTYTHSTFNMSMSTSLTSITSNADSQSILYECTSQELKDKLRSQFSEQSALKESLLVLDEVNDKVFVQAFDIGCKILITTRDTDVVSNLGAQIVKIENNFKEEESLKLFASCLYIDESKLPRQAKKIHEICKGSPFHIALFGAQLAENRQRFIDDRKLWNEYLKKLEKKEYFFITRRDDNPMKTIEICINSLKPNISYVFKMLAVLPYNAKVTTKVLSKLWNKEIVEVEAIMKQLRSKSLVIEFYDLESRNYIYEVHDLIMDYLRTCIKEDEMRKLHVDFLKSYHYDNLNAPMEIVDDGYIAFYIGYHILNTNNYESRWSLFNTLFLNLKFLGNKVRLTGPADVVLDLQKYENQIVKDQLDKDLLVDIQMFLNRHGSDLYRYPCTDIVQSILQHETKGILYTKAMQIAQENCARNELYFEFSHEQNVVEEIKPSTIDVTENIKCVDFLGDYVLVGTVSGVINVYHISTNKLKKVLPGTGAIKWLGACPINAPVVAVLTYDGVITMWYIDDIDQDEADGILEQAESDESIDSNYATNLTIHPKLGPFINCRWSNYKEVIIAHTFKKIFFYAPDGNLIKTLERDREILCCVPCKNDRHLISATSNSHHNVEVIDTITGQVLISFEESEPVLDVLTIPERDKIIVLSDKEVLEHEYKISTRSTQNSCNTCKSKTVITSDEIKDNLKFITIAINKSGTLLFVSTDDSRIICIDLKTNSRIFDLNNQRGNVVTMGLSEVWYEISPSMDILLTGTGTIENTAKVWYLDPSYVSQATQKDSKARLTTTFDVSFLNTLSPQTPVNTANSCIPSNNNTPKRHQSFANHAQAEKKLARHTLSLDRHSLKPLNLKGICNGNDDGVIQPLLAVLDDKNNIQIMRGRKILTEVSTKFNEQITAMKLSPCNQYIFYGLESGYVKRYTLRSKESNIVMDLNNSPVEYLNFVNPNLMIVAAKNRCMMAYRFTDDGDWKPMMMQTGNTHLGSQEILNDIQGRYSPSDNASNFNEFNNESSPISRLCRYLIDCFWINEVGLITVENNAVVKLWDKNLKLASVLTARQAELHVTCTTFKKNILVICYDYHKFQTFELKDEEQISLVLLQEYSLMNNIVSCALTEDGSLLALGLDSGDLVVWNVIGRRQLRLLKHHKTKVQHCSFSPVPERLYRSSLHTPLAQTHPASFDDEPPLVLISMASEIVWWDVTYLMKSQANMKQVWKTGLNVVSPLTSPLEHRRDVTAVTETTNTGQPGNVFFNDTLRSARDYWKATWKRKTYKEGSKRKEMLSCIKLSGMNAKTLCFDEKFSCFVTVDNPGHIHIMNLMRPHVT